MMNFGMELSLGQRQLLSLNQMQSLEILSMCNEELAQFLNNEYIENPMIEKEESSESTNQTEDFITYYERIHACEEGYGHEDKEERRETVFREEDRRSIETLVKDQLCPGKYTDKQMKIIEFMIHNLDGGGYYHTTPEETADMLKVPVKMVEVCLEDLKKLDPPGIFSYDLRECLLRQLEELGISDPTIVRIVSDYLEDISKGKISAITRDMGITSAQARKCIAFIRTLNPKPLSGYEDEEKNYIVPDIIASKLENGRWDVSLNDNWMPDYQLNEYYIHMLSGCKDEELKEYFQKKLERARMVINSIEQRRKTVISISEKILDCQKDFFAGKGQLQPMTMSEMADEMGVHPSTVSRTIKNKYLQYPGGVVLMKDLFSAGCASGNDTERMTAEQIKQLIRDMIKVEDPGKPLSDQKISEMLSEKGIQFSRRGVAKYREEMGIRGSFERKTVW